MESAPREEERTTSCALNRTNGLCVETVFVAGRKERKTLEGCSKIDILPALLSRRERPWAIGPLSNGDSYGVLQSIHLEESLRWVPASSEMHALPLRAWHG